VFAWFPALLAETLALQAEIEEQCKKMKAEIATLKQEIAVRDERVSKLKDRLQFSNVAASEELVKKVRCSI